MRKIITQATPKEIELSTGRLRMRLRTATKEQLSSIVCALSENLVKVTAFTPDEATRQALSADLVCGLLDAHGESAEMSHREEVLRSLRDQDSTDGGHVSELVQMFGRPGTLGQTAEGRRARKLEQIFG